MGVCGNEPLEALESVLCGGGCEQSGEGGPGQRREKSSLSHSPTASPLTSSILGI